MQKQKNQPCFTINLNSKVFCLLFYKKVRRTVEDACPYRKKSKVRLPKTSNSKVFCRFHTKRSVTPPLKQKNQPCFTINLNSKVFCPLFYKKVRRLLYIRSKSRKTNSDTTITLAQKFFVFFLQKWKVDFSTMFKQKNQPCFTINLNSKVFCLLFFKKVWCFFTKK